MRRYGQFKLIQQFKEQKSSGQDDILDRLSNCIIYIYLPIYRPRNQSPHQNTNRKSNAGICRNTMMVKGKNPKPESGESQKGKK
jgi:hypothetical protein